MLNNLDKLSKDNPYFNFQLTPEKQINVYLSGEFFEKYKEIWGFYWLDDWKKKGNFALVETPTGIKSLNLNFDFILKTRKNDIMFTYEWGPLTNIMTIERVAPVKRIIKKDKKIEMPQL